MERFNQVRPGVRVSWERWDFSEHHNKLLHTIIARSGGADVVGIEINHIDKFAMGPVSFGLMDVSGRMAPYRGQFVEYKIAQATTPDGRLIAVPWDIGPASLFYRRDLLRAAGYSDEPADVARSLATWDDYLSGDS